jgi:hypothetical protein
MSTDGQMDKERMTYTCSEVLFSLRKGGIPDIHYNMDEPQEHCASHKKTNLVLYGFTYTKSSQTLMIYAD